MLSRTHLKKVFSPSCQGANPVPTRQVTREKENVEGNPGKAGQMEAAWPEKSLEQNDPLQSDPDCLCAAGRGETGVCHRRKAEDLYHPKSSARIYDPVTRVCFVPRAIRFPLAHPPPILRSCHCASLSLRPSVLQGAFARQSPSLPIPGEIPFSAKLGTPESGSVWELSPC